MDYLNEKKKECYICKSMSVCQLDYSISNMRAFYACPVCGRYEIGTNRRKIDKNKLGPYLFYNRYASDSILEVKYHTTLEKEVCDQYRKEYLQGNNTHGFPVHMDMDMIEHWYPSSFNEKMDFIIRYIGEHTRHPGSSVVLKYQEAFSLLFVDRIEYSDTGEQTERNEEECKNEITFILKCLQDAQFITYQYGTSEEKMCRITMTPKGFSRLDEIQHSKAKGNNVLVAMQFGEDTKDLREYIKKGIVDAGYNPILIDEVEHNNFITPEIMKYIRDSKFVVADLTHQNNGAYFEEGYAMGLGKPVIQLCKKDVKLHFDIAQKNTIIWEKEGDIPLRLANRIRATIDR